MAWFQSRIFRMIEFAVVQDVSDPYRIKLFNHHLEPGLAGWHGLFVKQLSQSVPSCDPLFSVSAAKLM